VRRNVEGVGGCADDHVARAVADRARRMRHADDAGGSAIEALEQETRFDAEVLGDGGDVVGWQHERGDGEPVDAVPPQAGIAQRRGAGVVEELLHAMRGSLHVRRLSRADDANAFEGSAHFR
jgi:hypothetical protein